MPENDIFKCQTGLPVCNVFTSPCSSLSRIRDRLENLFLGTPTTTSLIGLANTYDISFLGFYSDLIVSFLEGRNHIPTFAFLRTIVLVRSLHRAR